MKPVMAATASTEVREDELVARAKAGDADAFEVLFRRYRVRIAGFVRANVREEGRVEDIVQEVFFAAHKSLPTLANPGVPCAFAKVTPPDDSTSDNAPAGTVTILKTCTGPVFGRLSSEVVTSAAGDFIHGYASDLH